MINLLDDDLRDLVLAAGAGAAVIWSRQHASLEALVLTSHPLNLLATDTVLPLPEELPAGRVTDPAQLALFVPTTLRIELDAQPCATEFFPLDEARLVLQVVWHDRAREASVDDRLHQLIAQRIRPLARGVAAAWHSRKQADRLNAVIDGLAEGIVSVDAAIGRADVNTAAAKLLGIDPGTVAAADFAIAMTELMDRATNRAEIASPIEQMLGDPSAEFKNIWRFADEPTHIRVTSTPVDQIGYTGRVWVFDDESALSQALAASTEATALVRAASDAVIDPLVLIEAVRDPGGRIVDFTYADVNEAACDYLGLRRDDLIGTTLTQTLPNIVGSGLMAQYIACAQTGIPLVLDNFFYYNEILQDPRHYDVRAGRAGTDRLSLTWRDVTERYVTARRIAESEEQFRLLAQNAADVVTRVRDGRFLWLSPSAEGLLGAPPQHWAGRKVADLIPPDDTAQHLARLHRLESGGTLSGRIQILDIQGKLHWIHLSAHPFYDSSGRQDGATATLRLIDDEVAAEDAAEDARERQQEADARFRKLIENSVVPAALVGLDGHHVITNQAFSDFLGYDAQTLRQMTPADLSAPEYIEAGLRAVRAIMTGEIEFYRATKQYIHADGHRVWGELSLSCVRNPADGKVENLVAQILDITDDIATRTKLTLSEQTNRALAERLQAEIASAAKYVESTLPDGLHGPVEITSRYMPSEQIGGDGLHYRWLDDDHLKVYLIDVSGHGVRPALLSVSVHNVIRSGVLPKDVLLKPDRVVSALNDMFQMDDQDGAYFTIWYGIYQRSTRTLSYASAGHPPALLMSRTGATVDATALASMDGPAGMFPGITFALETISVAPGAQLLVYSDGAFELPLGNGKHWTADDFRILCSEMAARPGWSLDSLIERLRAISAEGSFDDDCSLVLATFS